VANECPFTTVARSPIGEISPLLVAKAGPKYPVSRLAEAAPSPSPLRRRFAVGSAAQDLRRAPMTRRYTHLEHPHA
jgi:hypothetical protein